MKHSFRYIPIRRERSSDVQRGSMELWLSYIETSSKNQAPFIFYAVDADTGYGFKRSRIFIISTRRVGIRKLFQSFRCCMVSAIA